ncbi:MAG TPA: calcium-binding protein [Tepidisphaeraceae bacterium]|jgi:hypothetical protein
MATGKNKSRENRIVMEIIVDCYDSGERAMGWYCYLENELHFSFTARCAVKRAISPLKVGDEVEVIGMPPGSECEHEMFVLIRWEKDGLAVPLAQLKVGKDADRDTRQAVGDWIYWVEQGYEM